MYRDYKIVHGRRKEVEAEVKQLMKQGWEPLGGINHLVQENDMWSDVFCQAMVLSESKPNAHSSNYPITPGARD
jgi:hypothetical protein